MKPLLIVDGYNVIGAWSEAEKKGWPLDESRDRLMRQLEDYAGFSGEEILLVFDGYQSERTTTTEEKHGDLTLIFTRHGETADSYIERAAAQTPRYRELRVATSDGLEQSQVLSSGAIRMTSRELLRELREMRKSGMSAHQNQPNMNRNTIFPECRRTSAHGWKSCGAESEAGDAPCAARKAGEQFVRRSNECNESGQ